VDGAVLKMALMNLLDNAIKHAPHGSVIEASVASDAEGARIDIHNGGEAIAAEHRQRIFDRFYRVDAGRSRSAGGSGLGLSVTRWAVQMHGGSVSVVDDGRDGTTFRIRLPGGSEAQR
jgi:signal transduction histidine kinase